MVERVFVRHEIRKRRGTSGQGSDRRRRCRQRTENRAGNEGVNDKEIHREEEDVVDYLNKPSLFHASRSLSASDIRPKARSLEISRSPPGITKKNPFKSHTKLSGISTYSSFAPLLFSPNVISRTSYKEHRVSFVGLSRRHEILEGCLGSLEGGRILLAPCFPIY